MNVELHTGQAANEWLLWQLADSAFPTGGFSHSGGLEAAYQHHQVRNSSNFSAWCEAALFQLQFGAVPFAQAAFHTPCDWPIIDATCEAFLSNHVANRASRAQGRSFLAAVDRAFTTAETPALKTSISEQKVQGHLAPLHGIICRHLNLSAASAMRLFVFIQLRGWISSGIRLNILGPLEAQSVQFKLTASAEKTAILGSAISFRDAAQPTPLLDLYQGTQDRLYSRLFQS